MNISSLVEKIRAARRVYVIGNGGSYANAVHIANDLESADIRAHVLNPASLTRTANDEGYEYVFSRWIMLHGELGDLLIALSGSGKSLNILNAIEAAKLIGMEVHCEFGAAQGLDMQSSEERQIWLGHELRRILDRR